MTSRERWTIYPLLFLALGLAVRAVAVPEERLAAAKVGDLEAARLTCREIVLEAENGTVLIHMGRVIGAGGGRIEIKDERGVDSIAIGTRPQNRSGAVECYDADGKPAHCD
ncbi:MAG: hypothetical protein EBZ74_07975 [Planctomycetia bacterium]|nr:hypothetical protein [Planctomycetia bacterium]